jgi:hypothetical protein
MSILGKISPTSTSHTLVYSCPLATKAAVNITANNRSLDAVDVTLSLSVANDLGVSSIDVIDGGTGLTAIPSLTIAGTGTGATAEVSLTLTEATIGDGGTGYLIGDVATIVGGTGTAATFTVTAVDGNGTVTAASVETGGTYTAVITDSTAATTGGAGTGLEFTTSTIRYGIKTVTVTAPGNNYTSAPTVTASAGTDIILAAQMTRAAIEAVDALEYQVTIPAKGVLERTGITLGAGDAVFIQSSAADAINAFVFGVEAIA